MGIKIKTSLILILGLFLFTSICIAAVNTVSLQYIMQEKFDGRDLKLVRVISTAEAYTRYYITYMSGKYKISGIMDVPKGKGPFPAVITNHGFIDTKYYTNGRGLKREQDYLAKRGYVVLHPDWRNHNSSDKDPNNAYELNMGYTEDVINSVYAIKSSGFKFIDKENIGLLGHSLGGGIALNIMVTKPGLIKAYVLFAPISVDINDNFKRWIADLRPSVLRKYGPPATRQEIIKRYGSPESNPSFWAGLSPEIYVKNITDPVIVHQGLADREVPPTWADKLATVFERNGKNIKLYTYKGQPHEFTSAWPRVMKTSTSFFDSYLKH